MLENACEPHELETIFQPGFAAERIEELLWLREHGDRKRLAVIVDTLQEAGRRMQRAAATTNDPTDAPRIDEDAAMILLDDYVVAAQGSIVPVKRSEIVTAFAYMTNALVGMAIWSDDTRTAIIVL